LPPLGFVPPDPQEIQNPRRTGLRRAHRPAENRAMVRLLNIDIKPLDSLHLQDFDVYGLVDTNPGPGTTASPPI